MPTNPRPVRRITLMLALVAVVTGACGSSGHPAAPPSRSAPASAGGSDAAASTTAPGARPPASNVYAFAGANHLAPSVQNDPAIVYVPNSMSNTVTEIDQRTFKIIAEFPTGAVPQHVTPAWGLRRLYVDNDEGNTLTPIDPTSGRPGTPIPVEDPYNLYFTPDGRYAIVVAERLQRLDFRDPQTMALVHSLPVSMCPGVDHADFSVDGRYMYASCEFGAKMIEVDLQTQSVVRSLTMPRPDASPQDVKLSPDGRTLYTADQTSGGVWEIDPATFRVIGFMHTGAGAHGLYPSRDAQNMYVANRSAGSISVVSFATKQIVATWQLPLPASPDMGGVSADGGTLWLSGRYNSEVYAIDTHTGHLRARIPVGDGPHGLCVWPQPGRYSLGHTGITR